MTNAPRKDRVVDTVTADGSALAKYSAIFVGKPGMAALLRYELAMMLAAGRSGALGFALRKALLPGLFREVGSGTAYGRNLSLRCPDRMTIGSKVLIDDGCHLDARGADHADGFVIGSETLIARDTILVVKDSYIRIGASCSIGSQCCLSAVSGIEIGDHVIIAGQCYLGGGRYKKELGAGPMVDQGLETKGPVVLGNDVWVGAGARILDGVTIGSGAIIGAGAVVTDDVPPNSIFAGIPAKEIAQRQ